MKYLVELLQMYGYKPESQIPVGAESQPHQELGTPQDSCPLLSLVKYPFKTSPVGHTTIIDSVA